MTQQLVINTFFGGAIFAACFVISYLFWRSWQETGDRLFKLFSAAFAALGLERAILAFLATSNESIHLVYIVRLFAFGLIIWAIVDKNRSRQQ